MRTPSLQRAVRFDAFTLDPLRCVVLRGAVVLPLRPQAFDMLRYLAEHPGRLLLKEELLKAVWRGVTVSDDSLVRCIRDIREALGDRDHRIIKTIHKRGYLFDAEVSEPAAEPPSPRASPTSPHSPSARHAESVPTARREDRGEGQQLTPVVLVAAPRPNPLPACGERGPVAAVSRLAVPWRRSRAALLVGGALIVLAGVLVAADSRRELAPNANPGHYAILGGAIFDKERSATANREALALFDKALALDPNFVPALLGYARVIVMDVGDGRVPRHERSARLDQAAVAVERALKVEPGNGGAHLLRGNVWRLKGDPDRAIAAFERALAINPHHPWAFAELGRAKIEVGQAGEALGDIEMAIRLKPTELAIHIWYCWAGLAALHAGNNEAAAQWLQKALDAKPGYAFPVPLLAVAYAEIEREDEGRALIAEFLARTPSLTMWTIRQDFPSRNPTVAKQRERIAEVLRRLGVPES